MGSRTARAFLLACLGLAAAAVCAAQDGPRFLDVEFPHDSPVLPVTISLLGPTSVQLRGSSMALDVHASLVLRNTGTKQISGLTLLVQAQDSTSGRGSVSVPSLRVQPGELFPVSINLQLLRPLATAKMGGAMVQVSLDCALFSDLTAYGPDRLSSRRALTVYELEARRDRQYLAALLETRSLAKLREELNFGLQDLNLAQLGLELLRDPAAVSAGRDQPVSVGAVAFPSAPVKTLGGDAQISGNEVRSPRVEVRNATQKAVRSFEMGWIVRDDRGRDFVAGSVPSALALAPVQTANMVETGTLRFSHGTGQPMRIGGIIAFVSDVEFSDGKVWIPSRYDIVEATTDPVLRRALASSPEQQRLAEIYRHKGMTGLEEELKKSN